MLNKGKLALVTGVASAAGPGFAIARLLTGSGAKVWLTYMDAQAVHARAAELTKERRMAYGVAHDVIGAKRWQPGLLNLPLVAPLIKTKTDERILT